VQLQLTAVYTFYSSIYEYKKLLRRACCRHIECPEAEIDDSVSHQALYCVSIFAPRASILRVLQMDRDQSETKFGSRMRADTEECRVSGVT